MPRIHPTAVVDPLAELADDVEIGPYAILRGRVVLGPGTVVREHSVLQGLTRIGRNCRIGPAAYVGMDPQHKSYSGAETLCSIGDDVVIRETATVHRAFLPGPDHATTIGDRCYLMAGCHVGHDCHVSPDVTMANAALLGGHVSIGPRAFIGGGSIFHQFVRVGRLAIVAGQEGISQDVPPFAAVRLNSLKGYNAVGLRRADFPHDTIHAIRQAFQRLKRHRLVSEALAAIRREVPDLPEIRELLDFISAARRGIVPAHHLSASES